MLANSEETVSRKEGENRKNEISLTYNKTTNYSYEETEKNCTEKPHKKTLFSFSKLGLLLATLCTKANIHPFSENHHKDYFHNK